MAATSSSVRGWKPPSVLPQRLSVLTRRGMSSSFAPSSAKVSGRPRDLSQRLEPAAERRDAGTRGVSVGDAVADAEDVPREAGEARRVRFVDVRHPRGHHDSKAGAVRAVVERREFVLDAVARPVLDASRAADVVVRERAGPHDVRARLIVGGVRHHLRALLHDRAHHGLAEVVGERHVAGGLSPPAPRLRFSGSRLTMLFVEPSLPAAAIVSTTPTGSAAGITGRTFTSLPT